MTLEQQIQEDIKDMGKVMGPANKALAGLSDGSWCLGLRAGGLQVAQGQSVP